MMLNDFNCSVASSPCVCPEISTGDKVQLGKFTIYSSPFESVNGTANLNGFLTGLVGIAHDPPTFTLPCASSANSRGKYPASNEIVAERTADKSSCNIFDK